MSETLSAAQLKKRERRMHRVPALRCKTDEDIRAFVDEVGIALLFPVQGIELPNVYQAVAGFEKPVTIKHDDPTISLTWNTKDRALDKRWWYYGKLLRGKATLVSLDLLPSFYALSENYGELDDYKQLYAEGKLGSDARAIYEALHNEGALHAIALKRASGFYGEEKKARFDRALNELQKNLMVVPVGVAEAGAWRYAFIYELLPRWLPDVPTQARAVSRAAARKTIAQRHLANMIVCPPKQLARLFGWTLAEATQAVEAG